MAVPDLQDAIDHLQDEDVDAAIAALERKIEELPAHLTAHVLLARSYETAHQWEKALTCWENVRFLMPNSPVGREGKQRVLRRIDGTGAAAPRPAPPESSDDAESADDAASPERAESPDEATTPSAEAASPTGEAAPPSDEAAATTAPDPRASSPEESTASEADPAPREAPAADAAPAPDEEAVPGDEPAPDADTGDDADADQTDAQDTDAEDTDASDDSLTTAAKATTELAQLRKQAEEEAREGGARSDLSGASSSSSPADDVDDEPEPSASPPDPTEDTPSDASPAETPEERVDQLDEDDDLDRLIEELESARIEPGPDVENAPTPDLEDDVDDLVSETLARIHEAQGKYRRAAQIYMKLASQEPDQARSYLEKAAEMREHAEEQSED